MIYFTMLSALTHSSGKNVEGSSCGILRRIVENYNKLWKEVALAYLGGMWTSNLSVEESSYGLLRRTADN
jgi:hypothetical protein